MSLMFGMQSTSIFSNHGIDTTLPEGFHSILLQRFRYRYGGLRILTDQLLQRPDDNCTVSVVDGSFDILTSCSG
jgi:hypothetical protein